MPISKSWTKINNRMLGALQSLPVRPLHSLCVQGVEDGRDLGTGGSPTGSESGPCSPLRGGLTALMLSCVALSSCGKEAVKTPSVPAPIASAATSRPESKLETAISEALTPAASANITPRSPSQLREEAESILAKYPGKNAAELLGVPEVNERLRNALQKLGQDKSLQARIESSVELAGQIKGLEGAARLDLDVTKYDQQRTARMLEVVLTEDAKNLVNFLEGEIGEAVPDIAYGGVERAPNGVSIVSDPTKNKPAVKTELPE